MPACARDCCPCHYRHTANARHGATHSLGEARWCSLLQRCNSILAARVGAETRQIVGQGARALFHSTCDKECATKHAGRHGVGVGLRGVGLRSGCRQRVLGPQYRDDARGRYSATEPPRAGARDPPSTFGAAATARFSSTPTQHRRVCAFHCDGQLLVEVVLAAPLCLPRRRPRPFPLARVAAHYT